MFFAGSSYTPVIMSKLTTHILASRYCFLIKGAVLLGDIASSRAGAGKIEGEPGIFYCNGSLKNEFARGWKAFLAEKTVDAETHRHSLHSPSFSGVPSLS